MRYGCIHRRRRQHSVRMMCRLTSDEHFSVDGTLIDAWASQKMHVFGVSVSIVEPGGVKTPMLESAAGVRFILFHGKRHPVDMGKTEVSAFLTYLATERMLAASTQNQALAAILFLYRHVLHEDLPWLTDVVRAKRPERLPFVIGRDDVKKVLAMTKGVNRLITQLIYGTGVRVLEALRLRIRDLDFEYRQITVRSGKG